MRRSPVLVVVALLAVSVMATVSGVFDGSTSPGPRPADIARAPTASPAVSETPTGMPSPTAPPAADPTGLPGSRSPSPLDGPLVEIAVVPVTHFRSPRSTTGRQEVADVLAGTSGRYEALELVADEADAILAALGQARPADPSRLVLAETATDLTTDLASNRKRLAFLRADAVTPAVRALAWGSRTLFGVDRLTDLAEWRLTAPLPAAPAPSGGAFDAGATWTMFAGGDILLDRGVYEIVRVKGKGVDFPFDGGTAEITSRYCCSSFGWELPRTRRTGNAGAMRELIGGADLAIANFENPAPNKVRWHTKGTVFSADPGIIDGLVTAGIDYVGIANNHIGDAGRAGIAQTIRNLEKRGLAYSGAGENEAAARRPAMLEVNGTTVAILAYDRIAKYYFADGDTAGSAALSVRRVRVDIRKAREAGADVVVVFPHWGTEYRAGPFESQQALAHEIIDGGADMIIGNHAHWAAAMEVYKGKPIWYALGNFVFDQTWSEPTMEGITLELTFHRGTLVQVRIRPHIILDKAQPNFLDPAGDGRVVMSQVFGGPPGMLPW